MYIGLKIIFQTKHSVHVSLVLHQFLKKLKKIKIHTRSTIKSIASIISPSTFSVAKFPITIFFSTIEGKIQKLQTKEI